MRRDIWDKHPIGTAMIYDFSDGTKDLNVKNSEDTVFTVTGLQSGDEFPVIPQLCSLRKAPKHLQRWL